MEPGAGNAANDIFFGPGLKIKPIAVAEPEPALVERPHRSAAEISSLLLRLWASGYLQSWNEAERDPAELLPLRMPLTGPQPMSRLWPPTPPAARGLQGVFWLLQGQLLGREDSFKEYQLQIGIKADRQGVPSFVTGASWGPSGKCGVKGKLLSQGSWDLSATITEASHQLRRQTSQLRRPYLVKGVPAFAARSALAPFTMVDFQRLLDQIGA